MKVIDLLNKIANGKVDENTKYQISSVDYCTIREFFNRYIVDNETLNLEVIIEEDKKTEKIKTYDKDGNIFIDEQCFKYVPIDKHCLTDNEKVFVDRINKIIDKINKLENK